MSIALTSYRRAGHSSSYISSIMGGRKSWTGSCTIYLHLIGESPILHRNAASSLDTSSVTSRAITELARKRARTESEHTQLRELECQRSLWLSDGGRPMIPSAALRACIESAARRSKEGPGVRSGLVVDDTTFHFDVERYGDTLDEWGKQLSVHRAGGGAAQPHTADSGHASKRPWGLEAHLFAAADLIAPERLREWLEFAGQAHRAGRLAARAVRQSRALPCCRARACRRRRERGPARRIGLPPAVLGMPWTHTAWRGMAWQASGHTAATHFRRSEPDVVPTSARRSFLGSDSDIRSPARPALGSECSHHKLRD